MANDWQNLWQGQQPEGPRIVAEVLRNRAAAALRARKLDRIGQTLSVAVLTAIAISGIFLVDRMAQRIVFGLATTWILASLAGIWHGLRLTDNAELTACVSFCRTELQRRQQMLRNIWLWRAGPVLMLVAAVAYPAVERVGHLLPRALPFFGMLTLWLVILVVQSRMRLRAIDREIEELRSRAN